MAGLHQGIGIGDGERDPGGDLPCLSCIGGGDDTLAAGGEGLVRGRTAACDLLPGD